jgi:DNA invertase Pin-like site-specific DNA recombinase
MTDRYAAAYVRRSTADETNRGDVSREAQEAAVRELARHDGCEDGLRIFTDWGRSADEAKEAKRLEYGRLLAAVERGEVSNLYAYSLDRLARSVGTFSRLLRATKERNVRIATQREGDLSDTGNPTAWAYGFLASFFAEFELRTAKDRNQKAAKARAARGDAMGQPPYGQRIVRDASGQARKPISWEDDPARPLAPLLAAYGAAGTVLGACKLLNAARVPNARGGDLWQPTSLSLILDRAEVLPPHGHRRLYAKSAYLAGMLVCHCGRTMTPDHAHLRTGTAYYCARSKWIGTAVHGPGWVREAAILPEIRAEADRLAIPFDAVELGQQDDTARDSVAERKRRLSLAYVAGGLDDDIYQAELAAIVDTVTRLDAAAEVVELPPLNWDGPVAEVNANLRALFSPIQLAVDMTITEILWRAPELRRE